MTRTLSPRSAAYPLGAHISGPTITERVASSRAARELLRFWSRARRAMGIRRSFVVSGIVYREVSTETLGRALGKKGYGYKDYRVSFPDGTKRTIRCTPQRLYADLVGTLGVPGGGPLLRYSEFADLIRPGMRILELGCGTGYNADWLARRVGASGAVVAIDTDEESIDYARRRYRVPNVSFEAGQEDSLSGEADGAFDIVLALGCFDFAATLRPRGTPLAFIADLWRVVAPGGWLLLGAPGPAAATESLLEAACGPSEEFSDAAGLRSRGQTFPSLVHRLDDDRGLARFVVAKLPEPRSEA